MTKNIIKKMFIFLIIFAMIIMGMRIKVWAADAYTCNVKLVPDKDQIKAGETVTFDIEVSDIQAGSGIVIFNTIFEYDQNIFEEKFKVEKDDDGNWNNTLIENSITFTTASLEATMEDQVIGKITLTAKSDAKIGKQTISLTKNEFSSDDNKSFKVDDVVANVTIKDETLTPSDPQNPDDGDGDEEEGLDEEEEELDDEEEEEPSKNNKIPGGTTTSSQSGSSLPKTGGESFLAIGIFVAILSTVVFYIKYRRSY